MHQHPIQLVHAQLHSLGMYTANHGHRATFSIARAEMNCAATPHNPRTSLTISLRLCLASNTTISTKRIHSRIICLNPNSKGPRAKAIPSNLLLCFRASTTCLLSYQARCSTVGAAVNRRNNDNTMESCCNLSLS